MPLTLNAVSNNESGKECSKHSSLFFFFDTTQGHRHAFSG